jgi:hypothetical protein
LGVLFLFASACLSSDAFAQGQFRGPRPYRNDPRRGDYVEAPVLRWQRPDLGDAYDPYGIRPVGYGQDPNASQGVQFADEGAFADPFGDRLANQDAQPAPAAQLDLGSQPAPSPSNGTLNREPVPCDNIYNDRNCCEEDRQCDRVRDFLRRMKITNISVDITPGFRPETGSFYSVPGSTPSGAAEQAEDSRVGKLALAGPRTWRNREGQVVAEGRWTDYRYGRIYVSQGDGQVVQLPVYDLSDDDLCFVNAWWNLPAECTLGTDPFLGRHFVQTTFTWKASALCHKPIYFEQLQLERYGHTAGPVVQPFLSGAHFFVSIAALPYAMGVQPPNECVYQLGLYRPGSCAPWLVDPIPLSLRGALFQTGAVLGGIYLIP